MENLATPKPGGSDPISSVSQSFFHELFHEYKRQTLAILAISAAWFIFWVLMSFSADESTKQFSSYMVLLPVAAIFVYCAVIYNKIEHLFYKQFAEANGFIYAQNGQPANLEGALFNLGHSRSCDNLITGQFDGNSLELFTYRYTIGSGKNQQTYHDTVTRVGYPTPLPPLLLVVGREYFGGLVPLFSNWKKLELEGNFDQTFTLYTRQEYEVEALQVFAPDFMQTLMNNWSEFNLEFIDNQLVIFYNHTITSRNELQKMLDFAKFLVGKIEPLAARMKSDLAAMQIEAQKN